MKPWKAELLLLLMTIVWGATFMFTKIGLENTGPFFYLILRFLVAIILVFVFFSKKLFPIKGALIQQGIFLGILFGLGFILQTTGLERTSIQKSAFITGLTVVLTPFTFRIISRRKIMLFSKIGVVIAAVGLYLFTNPSVGNFNLGDLLTLFSTICWALFITYLDVFTKDDHSFKSTIQLVFLQMIGAVGVITIGFFLFEFSSFRFVINYDLISSVAFNGILASFILMIVHTNYQRYTTPVKAALIFSMEPIFAAFFAFAFMSEYLNQLETIGAVTMMTGVLSSELGQPMLKLFKRA